MTSYSKLSLAVFEITWGSKSECSIVFYPIIHRQYTQWTTLLEPFVSRVSHSTSVPRYLEDDDGVSVYSGVSLLPTEDERFGLKSAIARPWSLIGRKGNRSESSSMIGIEISDKASILSPNLLPTLFVNNLPRSPLHLSFLPQDDGIPSIHHLTESPTEYEGTQSEYLLVNGDSSTTAFPDLTQHVVKEGHYPIAHGGYSDVWRATWKKEDASMQVSFVAPLDFRFVILISSFQVAVKVLRNATNEPAAKEKLVKVCYAWNVHEHTPEFPL